MNEFDPVSFLRDVSLFAGLPEADLREIAAIAREHRFAGDEEIFREGAPGDRMYLIVEGRVAIARRAEDGQPARLAMLHSKDFFGEMALFDEVARSAGARAHRKEAVLLSLDRTHFQELLRRNPDLALRIIACQNGRLRRINEKVVEVDRQARKYAPSLEDLIVREYPHPIAVVFQEMTTAAEGGPRLRRLLDVFEVVLLYLRAICQARYLACGEGDPEIDEFICTRKGSPTLGTMSHIIGKILEHLRSRDTAGITARLGAWCGETERDSKPVGLLMTQLREMRNSLKHGSEASLDDAACGKLLEENRPKLMDLLDSLRFLRDSPLIFLQGMSFSEGVFHYSFQACMGAFRSFPTDSFAHAQPLESERLYLLDRSTGEVVPLSPWMDYRRCEACGDREVFLTQAWSERELQEIEFGRGHRRVSREVGSDVPRLLKRAETRVMEKKG